MFIAVDDLRPEPGAYGNPHIKTPHIDRLARTGVTFMRAYVQQAVCSPSRTSLMTGRRPDSLRVWDLQSHFRNTVPEVVTLPQHFMQHGYHAAAIGKIYHYGEWYLKAKATEIVDLPDSVYYDGAQTDAALEKLAALKDREQPFFFAIGYYRPHLPFNAPKRYWDLYDRAALPLAGNPDVPEDAPPMAINNMRELRGYADFKHAPHPFDGGLSEEEPRLLKHGYYASVSYIDAQIGRLLDALDDWGLSENTIVVLWGDHGWKLGEHYSWAKMTNYEIDTRTPLIIRAPGIGANGLQIDQMVEFVDLYPTLCEPAGLPLPGHVQGVSAVPLIGHPNRPWKKAVFSQFLREGIWTAPDGIEYMGYALRTDRYRYVAWMDWKTTAARER